MNNLDFDYTFFIQLANFLITVVVLNYLLIKPVRQQIKSRSNLVESMITEIEQLNSLSEKKLSSYEAELDNARYEAAQFRDSLKSEGHTKEHEILVKAQSDAHVFLQSSKEQVLQDTKLVLESLEKQVPQLAMNAASKILS